MWGEIPKINWWLVVTPIPAKAVTSRHDGRTERRGVVGNAGGGGVKRNGADNVGGTRPDIAGTRLRPYEQYDRVAAIRSCRPQHPAERLAAARRRQRHERSASLSASVRRQCRLEF